MNTTTRMPAVYLPHGGGPWPFTHEPMAGDPHMYDKMSEYMKKLGMVTPAAPRAILVVSAHWEEKEPTVMTSAAPPMLYDYYNFPPETYEVQWPAPGAPEVAEEVAIALQNAGFTAARDATRGFDHGVFVPLKLAYPQANVPSFQLSLKAGLDPAEHIKMGRALEPLRDKGVFIVGSGMSYHNLRVLIRNIRGASGIIEDSQRFDDWLFETMNSKADVMEQRLVEWEKAPAARSSHPREEHLLPLHVIAGAAGDDAASVPYRDVVMGAHVSSIHFG